MMTNKSTNTTPSERLSDIDNLTDLQAKIKFVRARIKTSEVELGERLQRLPVETLKLGASKVVPAFLDNAMAGNAIKLVTNAVGMLFGGNKETTPDGKPKSWTGKLAQPIKKIGLLTAVKLAYGLLKK